MTNGAVKRFLTSPGFWTAIFTGFLVLFTFFQVIINHHANQLNAANQRAMINFSGPAWQSIPSPDGKAIIGWRFGYGWSNSGRSPAREVISQVYYSLGDARPDKGLDFGNLPQGQTIQNVIGPGNGFGPPDVAISIANLEEVVAARKHLFFWGYATYDDGIPGTPRRLTEFCNDVISLAFSNPNDPTNIKTQLIASWPPCPVHNCYDEQSEDYAQRTK